MDSVHVPRETTSAHVSRLDRLLSEYAAQLAQLRADVELLKKELATLDQRVGTHVDRSERMLEDLRRLTGGVMDTVTGLANTLQTDVPLHQEMRVFMADQKQARLAREQKEERDRIKAAQEAQEIKDRLDKDRALAEARRRELARGVSAILGTVIFALGAYIVRNFIPRLGYALEPLSLVALAFAVAAFIWLNWGMGGRSR